MPTPTLDLYQGKFYAFWSDGGRSKRKSMGVADRAIAEARFAQWLLLGGHKGQIGEAAKAALTVGELWAIYTERHLSALPSSESNASSWRALEPHFGHLLPADIDQDVIDEYVDDRGVATGTARKEVSMVFACLNWHAHAKRGRNKLVEKRDIPTIDLPDASAPRDRWLSVDEIARLHEAAREMHKHEPRMSRVARFIWLALETAQRATAILELTWDRVDFETGMIHFERPGRRQTKKRRASVPISNVLRPVLERMHAERVDNLVFDHGGYIWEHVQRVVERAGIAEPKRVERGHVKATGISPHTFRHTAATHMARRGVPLYNVAGVLGNSMAMVEKVYAKHCPDRLRDAVNAIST